MFKRGAILVTLVHLLVVLSLVIESEQAGGCLSCLRPSSKDKLLMKLDSGDVAPSKVLELMKAALEKKNMEIGETSLQDLVQLDQVNPEACADDMAKSKAVAKAARAVNIQNLNWYCNDRLVKLERFCRKQASEAQAKEVVSTHQAGDANASKASDANTEPVDASTDAGGANTESAPSVPSIGQDTADFFRSFLGDCRSAHLSLSEIDQLDTTYLQGENGEKGKYPNLVAKQAALKENCRVLFDHDEELRKLERPTEQDGNDLTVDMKEPGWLRALAVCWYYHRELINNPPKTEASDANIKVQHQDQANDADQEKDAISQAGQPDRSMSQAVADFFSSILRDNAAEYISISEIQQLYQAYLRNEEGEFENIVQKQAQLRENCNTLVHNEDQLAEIDYPTELDRNELNVDMEQPAWWRALVFCKYTLKQ